MEYNCENNFSDLGFESAKECCDEYPEYCGNSNEKIEKKCSKTINFEDFKLANTECTTNAWTQQNNDCWLDSGLYALFASPVINHYTIKFLESLYSSDDEILKDIALSIANYLQGLYIAEWSKVKDCKPLYKNKFVKSLLEWSKNNKYILAKYNNSNTSNTSNTDNSGVSSANNSNSSSNNSSNSSNSSNNRRILQDAFFTKDYSGDIFSGPLDSLFKFISIIDKKNFKLITIPGNELNKLCKLYKTNNNSGTRSDSNSNSNSVAQKKNIAFIIKKTLSKYKTNSQPILFVSINLINTYSCLDETLIIDIAKNNNFELQSVVLGKGVHITALTLCNDEFIYYDNQNEPLLEKINKETDHVFKYAEQLMFIFKNTNLVGGNKYKNSKKQHKLLIKKNTKKNAKKY